MIRWLITHSQCPSGLSHGEKPICINQLPSRDPVPGIPRAPSTCWAKLKASSTPSLKPSRCAAARKASLLMLPLMFSSTCSSVGDWWWWNAAKIVDLMTEAAKIMDWTNNWGFKMMHKIWVQRQKSWYVLIQPAEISTWLLHKSNPLFGGEHFPRGLTP